MTARDVVLRLFRGLHGARPEGRPRARRRAVALEALESRSAPSPVFAIGPPPIALKDGPIDAPMTFSPDEPPRLEPRDEPDPDPEPVPDPEVGPGGG